MGLKRLIIDGQFTYCMSYTGFLYVLQYNVPNDKLLVQICTFCPWVMCHDRMMNIDGVSGEVPREIYAVTSKKKRRGQAYSKGHLTLPID